MPDQITVSLANENGDPVPGVEVKLYRDQQSGWMRIARRHTDGSGQVVDWPGAQFDKSLETGHYKLHFEIENGESPRLDPALYPYIEVAILLVRSAQRCHVAVVINETGYAVAIHAD